MNKKVEISLDLLLSISKIIKKDYPDVSEIIMKNIYLPKEKKAQEIVFDADF